MRAGMSQKLVMMGVLSAGIVAGISRDALAYVWSYDHFGEVGSTIVIGRDPNDNNSHWIGWQRKSDGACYWQYLGNDSGLTTDYYLVGGGGDDTIMIVSEFGTSFCGYTLFEPVANSYQITVLAGSGNDTVFSGLGGNHDLYGDDGNDFLWTLNSTNAFVDGGPHNDILASSYYGGGSGSQLIGHGGNDCLYINDSQSISADCGDGTDSWDGPGTRPASCETTVYNCCGVFDDCE